MFYQNKTSKKGNCHPIQDESVGKKEDVTKYSWHTFRGKLQTLRVQSGTMSPPKRAMFWKGMALSRNLMAWPLEENQKLIHLKTPPEAAFGWIIFHQSRLSFQDRIDNSISNAGPMVLQIERPYKGNIETFLDLSFGVSGRKSLIHLPLVMLESIPFEEFWASGRNN